MEGLAMRSASWTVPAFAAVLALLCGALPAGCGSDSGGGASGPSREQIVEANVASASRNAVLKLVQDRTGEAQSRAEAIRIRLGLSSTGEPPVGPDGKPLPPKPQPAELVKAEMELVRWNSVAALLRNQADAARVFQVKENKIDQAGADGMTSRLVVTPKAEYRDLLGEELAFTLEWVRSTRKSYDPVAKKQVIREYWEMRDSFPVKAAGGPGSKSE
jgi:hypothetical protein